MASTADLNHKTGQETKLRPLELICFGPPTARLGGKAPPTDVLWRKHLALLIYLALSPDRTRTREHLIGLLWPEKDQARARGSLNEALRRLRASLGAERLTSHETRITLSGDDLTVDALTLTEMEPEEALSLHRGDFLEGFVVEGAPAFEQWASSQRGRFQAGVIDSLVEVAELALERLDFAAAREAAQRALQFDPYTERAVRFLMLSAALAGDAGRAATSFNEFKARLKTELNEQPSRELRDLHDRIRAGRWRHRAARIDAAPDPPIVGRVDLHRAVFAQCRQGLHAEPRVVVIGGGEGLGKSRLLDECMDFAALNGAVTAVAHPLESDHDAPWSTLRQLLRDLTSAPGVLGAPPEALGVLTAIEPEFAPNAPAIERRDAAQAAAALAAGLTAIAAEQPVALGIDDAQFADAATLAVLRSALRRTSSAPVLVVLTSPAATSSLPRELLLFRKELGRGLQGTVAELSPMDLGDIEVLVVELAPWCTEAEQQNRLARRLAFETNGSPLFVVALLRALNDPSLLREDLLTWPIPRATMSTPLPVAVPDVVRAAVAMHLTTLEPPIAQILKAASILGQVDAALVAQTTDVPEPEVEQGLLELERLRFLVYDNSRFSFAAPLIGQVIRSQLVRAGERQALQARALVALEKRSDMASHVIRAQILADAGRLEEALQLAKEVANQALEQGSGRTARRSLDVAHRVSGPRARSELQELQARLAQQEETGQRSVPE